MFSQQSNHWLLLSIPFPALLFDDDNEEEEEEELVVEGIVYNDTMYLLDKRQNVVYSGIRDDDGNLVRIGSWNADDKTVIVDTTTAGTAPQLYPFPVDTADHCETPYEAYEDIDAVLKTTLHLVNNKSKHDIQLYDSYYCAGSFVEHMKNLQKEFFIQNDTVSSAPFTDLEEDEEDLIMKRAMRRSERWRKAKLSGKTNDEIEELFFEPKNMTVFSWDGDIDTLMTPIDSIRYYKHFLRAGMMSMNPKNGHVKAWVGGINYRNFQYDHVMLGKNSTFWIFLQKSLYSC